MALPFAAAARSMAWARLAQKWKMSPGRAARRRPALKKFFFEKKNQKTFVRFSFSLCREGAIR
jgi:hypothetical protein